MDRIVDLKSIGEPGDCEQPLHLVPHHEEPEGTAGIDQALLLGEEDTKPG
jgi:hypothetical protein